MPDLTAELIADMSVIRDVQLSPDGRFVAYTVAPVGKKDEHPVSTIWLASRPQAGDSPAGVQPRQFTSGTACDSRPRWSPGAGITGRRLAFLSDRETRGTAQLYVMAVEGGEATQLTFGKRAVATFEWSPDGSSIAFTSPDDPSEEDERRERERDDPRVHGEDWQYARLRLLCLEDGSIQTLIGGDRHVTDFCWSPDGPDTLRARGRERAGLRLACIIRPSPELDTTVNGPGRIVAISTGGAGDATEEVLCRFNGSAGQPVWTADGRWILCTRTVTGGPQSSYAVWRLPAGGGELKRLAGGDESCITALQQPCGAKRPVCFVMQGLDSALAWLDPRTGKLETLFRPPQGDFSAWSVTVHDEEPIVAVSLSLPDAPDEVYAGPAADVVCLTDHHPELAGIAFGRQSDFYFTARDGLELDGVLIMPPNAPPGHPAPMVVLVHGGPYGRSGRQLHLGWGDWGQWLATAGYAVLMPNPRGGCGHGEAFAGACLADVGGADWADVLAAIDAAVDRGIADPCRLGIGGWSQGGFMTAWAVTQDGEDRRPRFQAAVDGAGVTDWGMMTLTSDLPTFEAALAGDKPWDGAGPHRHDAISPISYARHVTTPTLILHGECDERVPVSQASGFHRALREIGATSQLVVYPREPHGIRERAHQLDVLRRVRDWFTRYLPA